VVVVFTDDSAGLALREEVERLRAAALLDPLTGIGNRRFGERGLLTMLGEMRRYGWPFGTVMLDLDDFKRVNDTLGHVVGDRVLTAVARTIAGNVRTFDVVARWGGDEFLVLLANLTGEELRHKAAALCAYVGESSVSTPAGTVNVTASVGATLALPGDSPESLVERADREMYRAKRSGRNRASLDARAPAPPPP
jgi:diguanylate cyclase (GGDEF)-like protein